MIMILTMMTLGREASKPWHVFLGFALSPGGMVMTIGMAMTKSKNITQSLSVLSFLWNLLMSYPAMFKPVVPFTANIMQSANFIWELLFCCIFVHCMSFLICSPNSCAISLPMPPESWIPREFIAQLRKSPSTWFCKMIKSFPSACRFVNLFQPVVSYKYNFKIHDHRAICLALGVCKSIKSFSTSWVEWNEVL